MRVLTRDHEEVWEGIRSKADVCLWVRREALVQFQAVPTDNGERILEGSVVTYHTLFSPLSFLVSDMDK